MTKAFIVTEKNYFGRPWQYGTTMIPSDSRPILVLATSIEDVAKTYKNASKIEELDVKDIVIDDKIDILLKRG
jgi:hypothetical protein